MARLQRMRAAEARQQAAAGGSKSDVFIPLSHDAEQFSGSLFKVALVLISLPMAGWFLSKVLLVALCVKGLSSSDPAIVRMSLSRVRTFIFTDYLATRFEQDDGVVMVVALLSHAGMLENEGVMLECLETVTHLMQFEDTRTALLLGMVTERLARALERGWVAPRAVEAARRVQQQLEGSKQESMEATFGRAAGSVA